MAASLTDCDLSALAASLSQAYGFSDPGERSQLLSSLVGLEMGGEGGFDLEGLGRGGGREGGGGGGGEGGGGWGEREGEGFLVTDTEGGGMVLPVPSSAIEEGHQQRGNDWTMDHPQPPPPPPPPPSPRPQLSGESAAVMIQASIRGYLLRKNLVRELRLKKAATAIQASWLGVVLF